MLKFTLQLKEDTLTVKDVATRYNIHPDTVRQHVKRGLLVPLDIPSPGSGRAFRFDVDNVERVYLSGIRLIA